MSASNSKQAQTRDLKHRVLTCLHKLSDRDTHAAAALELECIAKTVSVDALPPFLSSIAAIDSSDKSPVRRQCLRLITVLSEHHGDSLSLYLSKLLSTIVLRLRDPDSSVRALCVAASLSLSQHLTSPPFTSITKPFLDALLIEQDMNAQNGAALCLAAIIEGSANLDIGSLKKLLSRLEKLAKCQSFKAKTSLLALIGSVVGVKGVLNGGGGKNVIKNLVMCLMEFLSSEDWAARKAAAEALTKVAKVVEKEVLSEYKSLCLKTFEAKRFDKVKVAREMMNRMIEAWKEIPDMTDEVSPPSESQASSKEHYPPVSKISCPIGSPSPVRKRIPLDNPGSMAGKRSFLGGSGYKTGQAMFRKVDCKKSSDCKPEVVTPAGFSHSVDLDDNPSEGEDRALKVDESKQFANPDSGHAVFNKNYQKEKLDLLTNVSGGDLHGDASVVDSNDTGSICVNQTECEDISLIQKQLFQIENQQSNLFNLLQRFIGSSNNGIHSLEARVHGLELTLDEISFDLAVSTGRMSQNDAAGAMCCKLPGTEFLSSKIWRRTQPRSLISRLPSCGTQSVAAVHNISDENGDAEGLLLLENQICEPKGGRRLIVNPLAEISMVSQQFSEVSSREVVKNVAV